MKSLSFKLFVSSTFSDMKKERRLLHKEVLPQIKELCDTLNCEFTFIDLRWGINDYVQLDHQTMDICLHELKRCKETHLRPFIMILLGDRYGWEPPPATFEKDELQKMVNLLPQKIQHWLTDLYHLDQNAIPPQYILRKRTGQAKDYSIWSKIENHLILFLRQAAKKLELTREEHARYFCSATHQEIISALQKNYPDGGVSSEDAILSIRTTPQSETQRDPRLKELINTLKTRFNHHENLIEYNATGNENEGYQIDDEERWVRLVKESLFTEIKAEVARQEAAADEQLKLQSEEEHSLIRLDDATERMIIKRSEEFYGRETLRAQLTQYITIPKNTSHEHQHILLVGDGGLGKSSLMATIVSDLRAHADVIATFVGVTPSIRVERDLVLRLNEYLENRAGLEHSSYPSYDMERAHLHELLKTSSDERPLVILVDALDQLEDLSDQFSSWVLRTLPKHISIICSTRPLFKQYTQGFKEIELGSLSRDEGEHLLTAWLKQNGRSLTPLQFNSALNDFEVSGSPLYLRLITQKVSAWKSWTKPVSFPTQLKEVINQFFDDLHLTHTPRKDGCSAPLFERLVRLLVSNYTGLTEYEVLSWTLSDEELFKAFMETSFHELPNKELPYSVWSRVYSDLKPFLKMSDDGVISFFHREFAEIAHQKYHKSSIHDELYEYWRDRLTRRVPSKRALEEIVHHAFSSGDLAKIEAIFCDVRLILAMCEQGVIDQVLERHLSVLNQYTSSEGVSREFKAWVSFLVSHKHQLNGSLTSSPSQLCIQLALVSNNPVIRQAIEAWLSNHPSKVLYLLPSPSQLNQALNAPLDEAPLNERRGASENAPTQTLEHVLRYHISGAWRLKLNQSMTHLIAESGHEHTLVHLETGNIELKARQMRWFGDEHILYQVNDVWCLWHSLRNERVLNDVTFTLDAERFTDKQALVCEDASGEVSLLYADKDLFEARLHLSQEYPLNYAAVKSSASYGDHEGESELRLLGLSKGSLYLLDLNRGELMNAIHDPLIPRGHIRSVLSTAQGKIIWIGQKTLLTLNQTWDQISELEFNPPVAEREWRSLEQLGDRFGAFTGRTFIALFSLDDPLQVRYDQVADHHNMTVQLYESEAAWLLLGTLGYVWLSKQATSLIEARHVQVGGQIYRGFPFVRHHNYLFMTFHDYQQRSNNCLIIDISTGDYIKAPYNGHSTTSEEGAFWIAPKKKLYRFQFNSPHLDLDEPQSYQGAQTTSLLSISSTEVIISAGKTTSLWDLELGERWSIKSSISAAHLFAENKLRLWDNEQSWMVDLMTGEQIDETISLNLGSPTIEHHQGLVFSYHLSCLGVWSLQGDLIGLHHSMNSNFEKIIALPQMRFIVQNRNIYLDLIRVTSKNERDLSSTHDMKGVLPHVKYFISPSIVEEAPLNQLYLQSANDLYQVHSLTGEITPVELNLRKNASQKKRLQALRAFDQHHALADRLKKHHELIEQKEIFYEAYTNIQERYLSSRGTEIFINDHGACVEVSQGQEKILFQLPDLGIDLKKSREQEISFIYFDQLCLVFTFQGCYQWTPQEGLYEIYMNDIFMRLPDRFILHQDSLLIEYNLLVEPASVKNMVEVWSIKNACSLFKGRDILSILLESGELFVLYNEEGVDEGSNQESTPTIAIISQNGLISYKEPLILDSMNTSYIKVLSEGSTYHYNNYISYKYQSSLQVGQHQLVVPVVFDYRRVGFIHFDLKKMFKNELNHTRHYITEGERMNFLSSESHIYLYLHHYIIVFDKQQFAPVYQGSIVRLGVKHPDHLKFFLHQTTPLLILGDRFCYSDDKSIMLFEGDRLISEYPLSEKISLQALFVDHIAFIDSSKNYQRLYVSSLGAGSTAQELFP